MKGYFKRVLASCFNIESYRELIGQSFTTSLGYLTLLVLIASLLFSIMVGPAVIQAFNELVPWANKNVPEITLKDGVISSPAKQPHIMSKDEFYAVLDTSGYYKEIPDDVDNGILILKDRIVTKNHNQIKTYLLKDFPDFQVNASLIGRWLAALKWMAFPMVFLFTFCLSWLAKVFEVFFFSLLAMGFEAYRFKKLGFSNLVNLAAYALTLPIIMSLFVTAFNLAIPKMFYYYLLFIALFVWAINVCRTKPANG